MTLRFGSLAGAPSQAGVYTQIDAAYFDSITKTVVRDTITLAAAPAADTILACPAGGLGWESILDPDECWAHWSALGAGVTVSLGDATFPTALDNLVAMAAAGKANLLSAVTPPNYYLPLWQQLGYATLAAALAVAKQPTLIFTTSGAAATGTLTWRLEGSPRI
ncbi:MAG TPA: hypothetical protein VGF33_09960 [Caulobacteraceae bacterium]|jgi:hypothetical protein